MPSRTTLLAFLLIACLVANAVEAQEANEQPSRIEHGKYLVHRVAMCSQCHSPRDNRGELVEGKLLAGGRIPIDDPYGNRLWATTAPRLAGLPGYSEEEIVALLTQGRRPLSNPPRAPMPPFRFQTDDAQAIVAYLKSLGS